MLILDTDGERVTLPDDYRITDDLIAVRGTGTNFELWRAQFTVEGNALVFNDNIGVGKVYVGVPYRSSYTPTRPFRYDEDGSTITTDKIRVGRFVLSLVDTHELIMRKDATYTDPVELAFESRFVGQYRVGEIQAYTGDWLFSFGEEASLAEAIFFTRWLSWLYYC